MHPEKIAKRSSCMLDFIVYIFIVFKKSVYEPRSFSDVEHTIWFDRRSTISLLLLPVKRKGIIKGGGWGVEKSIGVDMERDICSFLLLHNVYPMEFHFTIVSNCSSRGLKLYQI